MFRIGEKQILIVEKKVPMGVYLKESEEETSEGKVKNARQTLQRNADKSLHGREDENGHVLLPRSQVPEGTEEGDELEVFLYRDSEDRLIATRKEPVLTLHQTGWLTVKDVGRVGAFLDWGLDKDLLLPFREQPKNRHVQRGEKVLAAVYLDKSGRLAATMNVYPYLRTDSPYQKGDIVSGTVYETSDNFGVFVAVDDRYSGLIAKKELVRPLHPEDQVRARVVSVRPDGKLDLSLRDRTEKQMSKDAEIILEKLKENGGVLPFTDKADPELIRDEMLMSKAQFKRAVGHLLKEKRITIGENAIEMIR